MNAPPNVERQLFDILGAVIFLKNLGADSTTPNFVRSLINTGQVQHIRIGRKFFIDRAELERWITNHQRKKK